MLFTFYSLSADILDSLIPCSRTFGFSADDNSHCGDSYSYRGEHLIPQREFLSPLISSFFVAAVKPVLLQVEDGCKIGPILVGHVKHSD